MLCILLWYTFLKKFLNFSFKETSCVLNNQSSKVEWFLSSGIQCATEHEDNLELRAGDIKFDSFQCVFSSISEEQNWKLAFHASYKLSIQTAVFPTTHIPYRIQKTIRTNDSYDWRNYRFKIYWTHMASLFVKEPRLHIGIHRIYKCVVCNFTMSYTSPVTTWFTTIFENRPVNTQFIQKLNRK
jgi:hypothetical protein